ncbi:MAG TPA: helix-hairpin-helix domain-containing protein [Gammaproteobacteria bacterium]
MQYFKKILGVLLLTLVTGLAFAADKVNINTADAETLASELAGVGSSKAEAIVSYREENGPFKSVESLTEVKGIGQKVLEDNAGRISVGE